jgi:hypothetical protein
MKFSVALSIFHAFALCYSLTACDTANQTADTTTTGTSVATNGKMPVIALREKEVFDFGTLTEGDTVEHVFQFTNTGNFPLIINNLTASCGCTTPEWPRDPIAPGEASSVRVRFNSRGKQGQQNKTVTIFANTEPAMTEIQFKAMVNPKADSTQAN